MKFTIYKYTSPSKRCYIGITNNEEKRKREHARKEWDMSDTCKFAQAIRKYGFHQFGYEKIDEADTSFDAGEKEKQYIKFYDSLNSGYNLTEGGEYNIVNKYEDRVVQDIRFLLKYTDLKQHEIAEKTGVSRTYISAVKNGNIRTVEKINRKSHQSQKGEVNMQSKLSNEKIKEIQNAIQTGTSRRELQEKYNVSKSLIQQIATNNIWKHVETEYEYKPLEVNGNAKLDAEKVKLIKQDIREKVLTMKQISDKFSISVPTLYQIKRGKTWKDIE